MVNPDVKLLILHHLIQISRWLFEDAVERILEARGRGAQGRGRRAPLGWPCCVLRAGGADIAFTVQ